MKPNRINYFIAPSSLGAQADKLVSVQKRLAGILPSFLSGHVRVGKAEEGKLVLYADNSSMAAKLKQFSSTIKDKLGYGEVRILVWVRQPHPPQKFGRNAMGEKGAECFRRLEESLPDSPLKTAIHAMLERRAKGPPPT